MIPRGLHRTSVSPHDQRRWRRDGRAVRPGGRFRPKLLKEMRRVAWLAKCLQSAEIRVRRLSALAGGCVGRTDVHRASSIGDGFDLQRKCRDQLLFLIPDIINADTEVRSAMLKENVGISSFF